MVRDGGWVREEDLLERRSIGQEGGWVQVTGGEVTKKYNQGNANPSTTTLPFSPARGSSHLGSRTFLCSRPLPPPPPPPYLPHVDHNRHAKPRR